MKPRLSFCVATFNRAAFLAVTLESIIAQATSDCEIVVSDNASTDNTEEVVAEYARRFDRLRYYKQDSNKGLDRNFDRAVELARGEFCWLMPDDDVLRPGAVSIVLRAMRGDLSLIAVNVEFMDFTLSRVIHKAVNFQEDRIYEPDEMDRLFAEAGMRSTYIGSFVIRREIWMARDRQRYFGSEVIHIGVIYQRRLPGRTLLIVQPLVSMRLGNTHAWWSRQFDIYMFLMSEQFAASLDLPQLRKEVAHTKPWKKVKNLLWFRAVGTYSFLEYRRKIHPKVTSIGEMLLPVSVALVPAFMVHAYFLLYFKLTRRSWGNLPPEWHLQVLSESRFQRRSRSCPPYQGTTSGYRHDLQ